MKKGLLLGLALLLLVGIMPAAAQETSFWHTEGYGLVIAQTGDQVALYEITEVSCVPIYEGDLAQMGVTATISDGRLIVIDDGTLHIEAEPLTELPAACANGGPAPTDDPEVNFEIFWHTFNEQYAFFELYGVDWQATYDQYRPQVTNETTPEALFAIFEQMLTPLKDGHISLVSDFDYFSPGSLPAWANNSEETMIQVLLAAFSVISQDYLGEDQAFMDAIITQTENGPQVNQRLFYGSINERVGYINLLGMEGYATGEQSELEAAAALIDEALAALAGKEAIVIDVRFNGGGYDSVALTFASRFADQERLSHTKQARNGDRLTPTRDFYIQPDGPQPFTKPVIVLTSGMTASAAEIFVMAMRTLPNVTVIGEPTSGGHSDILGRKLPNGWQFGLSNEVYTLADGQVYEGVGIPPTLEIPLDAAAYDQHHDTMLDTALQTLTP
ncbi:MAG TPA: S41 family peptidase [Phototrophicaceae bacterium]|nr:S41 family peptidase [Phototrophicaceae bacterium]